MSCRREQSPDLQPRQWEATPNGPVQRAATNITPSSSRRDEIATWRDQCSFCSSARSMR